MSNPLAKSFQEQKSSLFESMKLHQFDRNEMLRLLKSEMELLIKNRYSNSELDELKKKLETEQKIYDTDKMIMTKEQRKECKDEIAELKQDIKEKIKEIKDTYNMLKETYNQLLTMENNQDFTFMQILQSKGGNDTGREKIAGVLFDQESASSEAVTQLTSEQQKELDDLDNISDAEFRIVDNTPKKEE